MNSKLGISKSYSLVAEEYSSKLLNELEQKNFDQIILRWYALQIPKDETILEIGAGPGQISGYLNEQGVNCIGTDISAEMVENARKNFPNISFEVQDFFNLTYMDNSFYGVVGFYAIVNYALDSIKPVFEEMKRVLKQITGSVLRCKTKNNIDFNNKKRLCFHVDVFY